MFIVNHFDAPVPFFVEELNGAVLKMVMRSGKIPITRWPEIRMDKLHHKKVMDPHRLVMAFVVVKKLLSFGTSQPHSTLPFTVSPNSACALVGLRV